MLEIRNRKTIWSKIKVCKSDLKIGDCAHSLHLISLFVAVNIILFNMSTGSNKIANDFRNLFLSYFYQLLIDKPTMEVNTSSTLLDNIYTNKSESGNICTSGIMKTDFSDHYLFYIQS